MMILVYICERLIKQVNPAIFEHMQKKGISCQQFSTNPLITLFTWHFKKSDKKTGKKLLHLIWDMIVLVGNSYIRHRAGTPSFQSSYTSCLL